MIDEFVADLAGPYQGNDGRPALGESVSSYLRNTPGESLPTAKALSQKSPKNAALDRVKALRDAAQAASQADDRFRKAIQAKIIHANVLGVPDKSLVTMANLQKLGIGGDLAEGIPYGVSPQDLTDEEKQWMIDTATRIGRERQ